MPHTSVGQINRVNHLWRLVVSLGITISIASFSSISLAQASVHIYCVSATGAATTAPCFNKTAFPAIQTAIDTAKSGDEIRIADGVYTPGNGLAVVSIENKGFVLGGGYTDTNWSTPSTSGLTIIDGEDRRPGFEIYNSQDMTIENVTIQHGSSNGNTGGGIDANMLPSTTLSLINVVITNNTALYGGGGLFVAGGTASLLYCQVINNTVTSEDGGGFYGFDLVMSHSIIANNTAARRGGGIVADNVAIEDSLIVGNTATTSEGGGLVVSENDPSGSLAITRTRISANKAGAGGAIYIGPINSASLSWSLLDSNTSTDGSNIIVDTNKGAQISLQNVTIAGRSLAGEVAIVIGRFKPASPATLLLVNTVVTHFVTGIRGQLLCVPQPRSYISEALLSLYAALICISE